MREDALGRWRWHLDRQWRLSREMSKDRTIWVPRVASTEAVEADCEAHRKSRQEEYIEQ